MKLRFIRALCLLSLALPACSSSPSSPDVDDSSGDEVEPAPRKPGVVRSPDTGHKLGADLQARLKRLPHAKVMDMAGGVPTIVQGNLGAFEVHDDPGKADLQGVLTAIAQVFKADAGSLRLSKSHTDRSGWQHFRFRQTKNGLEVLGDELVLHARDGIVRTANGNVRDDADAPATPQIAAGDAEREARDSTDATGVTVSSPASLAYIHDGARLDLVYRVDVRGTRADRTPVFDTVLVNATTGKVVQRIPHIHEAKVREVHDAQHGAELPGPLARGENDPPVADEVVNANWEMLGTTYDCYQTLFGRDSYDGKGAPLISSVHYGEHFLNAYWDHTQMVYGDGDDDMAGNFAVALDVTAHELTHAVTESESNLTYAGESGGLNESMSDIFGEVCEWFRDGQVISDKTWMMGEEIWTPSQPGDALRYMNDPARDGSSLDDYRDYNPSTDVHYSSGISNLAFYLLSQGGSHPRHKVDKVVNGIGILKAAQVFYQANTEIFTPSTTFAQAQILTQVAAKQLGFTEAEVQSVADAWTAAGVGVADEAPTVTPLENDVPVSGLSGEAGSHTYFSLEVPRNAGAVTFHTTGGVGDVDLYGLYGSLPSMEHFSCASVSTTTEETCVLRDLVPGTYFIDLLAFAPYSDVTLTGSFGTPPAEGHIVLNEIDYDSPGPDDREFVEIWNGTQHDADLSTISLLFVDGLDGSIYGSVPLGQARSLAPGQFLVVGNQNVTVPDGAKKVDFIGPQEERILNEGPAGVLLFDNATGHVVDALSYEGSVTEARIPGAGTVSLVEGTALPANVCDSDRVPRSLGRFINGTDTDDAAADWAATSTPTPGSLNLL